MKITHIKVGVEFDALLSTHALFQGKGYKAISGCHHFLLTLFEKSVCLKSKTVEFHSKGIQSIFQDYGVSYTACVKALESLGLLVVNRCAYFDKGNPGNCRQNQYGITDFCKTLLTSDAKCYLRELHGQTKEGKKARHNRSRTKKRAITSHSSDAAIDFNTKALWALEYDQSRVDNILASNAFSKDQAFSIHNSLIKFKLGHIKTLKRAAADGRIHHLWVQMKSEVRPAFSMNGKPYRYVIDIRTCHPTFFSTFICAIWERVCSQNIEDAENGKKCNILTNLITLDHLNELNILPSNFVHYFTISGDTLETEHARWMEFWTDENVNPRTSIATDLGIDCDRVKKLINSAMNGSKNRVYSWIESNYPTLFFLWNQSNLKKTGPFLSRLFETPLILDGDLYKLSESIGLSIISEHDGLGVFCDETDEVCRQRMDVLIKHIQKKSRQKFGFSVVLKVKQP